MLNKVHLIGRLGKDPEFRTTNSGIAVATFSLATDEKRKNESGETTSKTEWHKIVAFRRQAEVARDYLRKGSLIYLEGKIHYDSYENREGQKVYTTEITCENFQMLSGRDGTDQQQETRTAPLPEQAGGHDDLPF